MKKTILFILLFPLFLSCARQETETIERDQEAEHCPPKYAKGFDLYKHQAFVEIVLFNPWKDKEIVTRYYLVREDSTNIPADGVRVKIPLKRIASTSVTQYEFLAMLGETDAIAGICNPELTYNELITSLYNQGKIANLGDAFSINKETVMALNPDAIMTSFYNASSISQQISAFPNNLVLFDNEWTESSPLARAEWIKFIAAFFDKTELADTLFNTIDSSYASALSLVKNVKEKPVVMVGGNFKGTWYMPGGQTYMGKLLSDAGADYKYSNDTKTTSLPLNFETVLQQFSNADVWLNAPASTVDEILKMDERHKLFAPINNSRTFGFYGKTRKQANDFWESGVAHPDVILKDIIWALYPEKMQDYTPVYISVCR